MRFVPDKLKRINVFHRFWECPTVQQAWQWAIHILNTLITSTEKVGPWCPLTWRQVIFSIPIPLEFNPVKRVWLEIRMVVIWSLWIQRNDKAFNDQVWTTERLLHHIWLEMLDLWAFRMGTYQI